ncbi:serine hydrolase [Flindersiella endophytica]
MHIRRTWRRALAWVGAGATATGLLLAGAPAEAGTGGSAALAEQVRQAMVAQKFNEVVDLMPPASQAAATSARDEDGFDLSGQQSRARSKAAVDAADPPQAHQMPNVDTAIIELDGKGRPVSAVDVLMSPKYPNGVVVPLNRNLDTTAVRWRSWNTAEWNAGSTGSVDLVPGRENAPLEHMATYPASVLKLMVGFSVLRLVDRGDISLDDTLPYQPVDTSCGAPDTDTIRGWFDRMQTVSENRAACALIMMLYQRNAVDETNQLFRDLGLPTLQMVAARGTETGGGWINTMKMTSMETAKLLLVVNSSPGVLWRKPTGEPVTRDLLSASSRAFYYETLKEQGLNQVLTTTNWCGRAYPAEGLIQKVDERWINPADGTMTVDGRVYGQDVRPCNARAEVTFAHKTGLSDHGGVDAGIVHSLPGKPVRNYIMVVNSNLGARYTDANRPADPPGIYPVAYTEKLGLLGKGLDGIMTTRHCTQAVEQAMTAALAAARG